MSQLNVGTINATNVTATGEVDVDATLKLPQKTTAQLPTSGVVAGGNGTKYYYQQDNGI